MNIACLDKIQYTDDDIPPTNYKKIFKVIDDKSFGSRNEKVVKKITEEQDRNGDTEE